MPTDDRLLQSLRFRCIGPPRGGRVVAVAGDPQNPAVFYFGACAGGIWKTDDGGSYWQNISDGFVQTAAVGALAVAPSDPNVIYAGMGEACPRGNVSHGDGVYRSTDGGRSWEQRGLRDTRHIGRVRVHPQNADLVYVAALGHLFGPNEERGVFRSTDGGAHWERVLFRDADTGAIDLCLDPTNPRVLYATLWQVRRNFWELHSGGPGSGLFRSTDGGDSWEELSGRPGLPVGLKGRIGVAAAPRAGRLWALVEAPEAGLFRSDDYGESWKLVNDDRNLRHRPWYYMHVVADPSDAETLHVLNLKHWRSDDAGKSFSEITTPHGDNHDVWIDPADPRRMVQGNDGGACVSYNGGASWSTIYNQMTAQFYHVAADSQWPYRVYGTQQDNSSISTPSRHHSGAIAWQASYAAGTGESGYIAVKPDDPNIVLVGAVGSSPGGGGALQRYDHRSGQIRLVTVWPEIYGGWGAKDLKYRFQWTFPILFSPHDPNLLYTCGNVAFRSTDLGGSWEPFSPDLTRADLSKLGPSGGPITKDTTGAEHYATIFAFAESPLTPGLFWAGSDDGLVHISRDNGAHWQEITPTDLAPWTLVSMIEPSPHDPAVAYLAATRYKLDDNRPMLYKTADYGASWELITGGLPDDDFTRVIRCDPERPGLLYCGSERGVYVSLDDGASWQALSAGLPIVPVHDLIVKDGDLVLATHGRSFWILDDISPLRQIDTEQTGQPLLCRPRDTVRVPPQIFGWRGGEAGKNYMIGLGAAATFTQRTGPDGEMQVQMLDSGENPPAGVIVHYFLPEVPAADAELSLIFLDSTGSEIRSFRRRPEKPDNSGPWLPARAGMNRFVWNMRYPDPLKLPGDPTTEAVAGPLAPPGSYSVRLVLGEQQFSQSFRILKDPRSAASQVDLDEQFGLLIEIRDKLSTVHAAIVQLRSVKKQLDGLIERLTGNAERAGLVDDAKELAARLSAIEEELVQTKAKTAFDTINIPSRLNAKLAALPSVVASADAAPTKQAREVFADLGGRIAAQLAALHTLYSSDLAALNRAAAGVPAVILPGEPAA